MLEWTRCFRKEKTEKKGFVALEKILMGCRKGTRYLKHDVYYTPSPSDRPIILARRYDAVDTGVNRMFLDLIELGSLYATKEYYNSVGWESQESPHGS